MNLIRRAWRAMWFKDDDDNTPQGKLARGCFYLFYWIVGTAIAAGIAQSLFQYLGWKP
jgi:hypothetical protein